MYRQRRSGGVGMAVPVLLVFALLLFPLLTSGEPEGATRELPVPEDGAVETAEAAEDAAVPAEETEPETVPEEPESDPEPVEEPAPEPVVYGPQPLSAVTQAQSAPSEVFGPFPPGASDSASTLRVLHNGSVMTLEFGTYLAGVLRGEMPASFELEALKAQAVAARTYTRRMIHNGGKHGDRADICTNPGCCQAWKSEADARKGWGEYADEYEAKIEAAVAATDGQNILYGGEPILAVFHSSSPGLTQEVGQVWGGEAAYLVPVSSPEQAENVPNYYSRAEFTLDRFRQKVLAAVSGTDFSGPPSGWLSDAERNAAGTVETLRVGGVSMRGSKLRGILGLRSACFTWEIQGESIVFYVTAFGHGVGLSQYGANQMARDGADYREILTHYYTGVTLGPWVP